MQLLLHQPGDSPIILLSQERVTNYDPLFMVLYGITLVSLSENLRDTNPTLLSPFYADYVAFDESVRQSAVQLCLLMDQGPDQGYFLDTTRLIFISDNSEEKEAEKRKFKQVGLSLNYIDGSRYLVAYLGPKEQLEAWVSPKVDAWDHRVHTLSKIAKQYPQFAYSGLEMSLQI